MLKVIFSIILLSSRVLRFQLREWALLTITDFDNSVWLGWFVIMQSG